MKSNFPENQPQFNAVFDRNSLLPESSPHDNRIPKNSSLRFSKQIPSVKQPSNLLTDPVPNPFDEDHIPRGSQKGSPSEITLQ